MSATLRRSVIGGLLLGLSGAVVSPALFSAPAHPAARPRAGFVTGLVLDSLSGNALADVSVFFTRADDAAAAPYVAITDSTGRYVLRDVAPGRYLAGFTPTPLDSMGIEAPSRVVEIGVADQTVNLATPSAATITNAICSGRSTDSTALLVGHVRDTRAREPIDGATVLLDWNELIVRQGSLIQRGRVLEARTGGPGWFAVCDLPGDVFVTLRASHGADTSGFMEIALAPGGLHHVSFLVGGAASVVRSNVPVAPGVTSARADVVTAPVWSGNASLSGTVVNDVGEPVRGATVGIWGTYRTVVTSERGAFTLDSLPGGTQTLEVRLIGWEPVRKVVHLSEQRPASVRVVLGERVVVLEGVQVIGQLAYAQRLAQFERRRRSSTSGYFLRPVDLERRPSTMLARLVQGFPGVKVSCARGECIVTMRGVQQGANGPAECVPSLWVDGRRDMLGDFGFLYSDEIAALEVYPRDFGKPPEFNDFNACGAVVVWTKPLPPDPQKRTAR